MKDLLRTLRRGANYLFDVSNRPDLWLKGTQLLRKQRFLMSSTRDRRKKDGRLTAGTDLQGTTAERPQQR